jgi:hypothetical protein
MHLHITQQVAGQHVVDLWFHAHSELFVVHLRHALAQSPNTLCVHTCSVSVLVHTACSKAFEMLHYCRDVLLTSISS